MPPQLWPVVPLHLIVLKYNGLISNLCPLISREDGSMSLNSIRAPVPDLPRMTLSFTTPRRFTSAHSTSS